MHNISEVIIQIQIYFLQVFPCKLVSEENMVPRALFEGTKVAGSAKYKPIKPSFKVKICLFCIFSHENSLFILFV